MNDLIVQDPCEILLLNIKKDLPSLKKLLKEISGYWTYEDCIYRFYHGSFKVYAIQDYTFKMVNALAKLAPEGAVINSQFEKILRAGIGKKFKQKHNNNWDKHTRPLLEAFFHAKYFLEMAVKYGKGYKKAPERMHSGWAGLLYYYNLR